MRDQIKLADAQPFGNDNEIIILSRRPVALPHELTLLLLLLACGLIAWALTLWGLHAAWRVVRWWPRLSLTVTMAVGLIVWTSQRRRVVS